MAPSYPTRILSRIKALSLAIKSLSSKRIYVIFEEICLLANFKRLVNKNARVRLIYLFSSTTLFTLKHISVVLLNQLWPQAIEDRSVTWAIVVSRMSLIDLASPSQ